MAAPMDPLYHLTTADAWAEAQAAGDYRPASLDIEGFIHASTAAQVEGSANRFFAGVASLVVLVIRPDRVAAPLRWDPSPHHPEPFPHVYGPLNLDAVAETHAWDRSADGSFHWPPSGLSA
jgi:uncharacterized protein (DUF952 family)